MKTLKKERKATAPFLRGAGAIGRRKGWAAAIGYRFISLMLMFMLFTSSSCSEDKTNIIDIGQEPEKPVDENYNPTPFAGVPATQDIVMYEMNPRLFGSSGAFQKIIERLDGIRDLGVNVLWLMPIHPVGQVNSVNSPYSVQDYTKVNPEFGTLDDFRALVDAAHERGMAVIIDWVANHTAWDHPWIENKSWYSQDGAGNIIIPPDTDWQDVADLNFESIPMKRAMIDAMKYWVINANIDGFRCDAADFVPFSFWRQAITELDAIQGRTLIHLAEGIRRDHMDAGFHMVYAWDFYAALKRVYVDQQTAKHIMDVNNSENATLPEGKHVLRFTTNHDYSAWEATPVTLFGGQKAALSAFVVTIASDGVPLLYSSQEAGLSGTVSFFNASVVNWNQNPEVTVMYETIMTTYNNSAALRKGNTTWQGNSDVWLVIKEYGQEKVAVIANTRNALSSVELPEGLRNRTLTDELTGEAVGLGQNLELDNYQYLILKISE